MAIRDAAVARAALGGWPSIKKLHLAGGTRIIWVALLVTEPMIAACFGSHPADYPSNCTHPAITSLVNAATKIPP